MSSFESDGRSKWREKFAANVYVWENVSLQRHLISSQTTGWNQLDTEDVNNVRQIINAVLQ